MIAFTEIDLQIKNPFSMKTGQRIHTYIYIYMTTKIQIELSKRDNMNQG